MEGEAQMTNEAREGAERVEDVGQAQRLAHAEKTQREVEAAVGAEQENKVPNPVPAVFEALDKGQKIKEREWDRIERERAVFNFAERAKGLIDAEEVVAADPRDVIAKKLLEDGKLKDSVLISGLGEDGRSGPGEGLMRQNVVPTLRALGAIPGNAPDHLPHGEENDFLVRLLRKGAVVEKEGKAYILDGSMREEVVLTKDTNVPGVDARVVIRKEFIHDYNSIYNPDGYPLISRMELVFSPQALASMEPGLITEPQK